MKDHLTFNNFFFNFTFWQSINSPPLNLVNWVHRYYLIPMENNQKEHIKNFSAN